MHFTKTSSGNVSIMESCAHEQQLRHLRSRVSQLEIMLEKEKRLRNASSSQYPPQALIPRRASSVEILQSPEYRKLQAEIEGERRVKQDLMANLKEMTTTNDTARAHLISEMDELKASKDTLSADLDELQDEFDRLRTSFGPELGDQVDQRLSPISLKAFATTLTSVHAQQRDVLIKSFFSHVPKDMSSDISEEALVKALDDLSLLRPSKGDQEALRSLAALLDMNEDATLHQICTAATSKTSNLEQDRAACLRLLQQSVPAAFEDIFTLLNRSSSFVYPAKIASLDDHVSDAYNSYLKSTSSRLSHTIRKYMTSHHKSRQKISYRSFSAGDLALFLPTRNAQSPAWAAFNVGAPHYFLDMNGVETEGKDFLIGRVQDIAEKSGEPGIETSSIGSRIAQDERKWWQVKISEKKKVSAD